MPNGITASRGAIWIVAEILVATVGAFLTTFVVARLIGPAGTGLAALAAAVVMLMQPACAYAFTNAMIQRPRLTEEAVATIFWVTLGFAAALTLLICAAALAFDEWMTPGMAPLLAVLAFILPFNAVEGTANGVLMRRQDFRALALRTIGAHLAAFAVGVSLALSGAGAWSVVGQQLAYFLTAASLAAVFVPLKPRMILRLDSLVGMWRFAMTSSIWGFVQRANFRVFLLVVAAGETPELAGILQITFRITEAVRELVAPFVHRYALPTLSRLQERHAAFAESLEAMILISGLCFAPLFVGLALVVREVQTLLLGPEWEGVVAPIRVLAVVLALTAWSNPIGMAFTARGRPQLSIHLALAGLVSMAAAGLIVRPQEPVAAAAVWTVSVLVPVAIATVLARRLDLPLWRQLRAAAVSLLPAAATAASVFLVEWVGLVPDGPLGALAVKVAVGGAAGMLLIIALGRRPWRVVTEVAVETDSALPTGGASHSRR